MTAPVNLCALLAEGKHPLAAGRVLEVTAFIRAHPQKAARLIECLFDDDPGVASRAADVLERMTHTPSRALNRILAESKEALLGLLAEARPKKFRWNLALILGRLPLTIPECRRAAAALQSYLDDPSSIVKTAAMQGLADLTRHDPALLPEVLDQLRILSRSGTPAMRARGRLLLIQLEKPRKTAKK